MSKTALFSILVLLLLAACAPPIPIPDDSEIEAARSACAQWRKLDEKYTGCITNEAVAALNPDICRLLGIAIDDMCLQAVYEAADDPAICAKLYLKSMRPTCHAYYADPNHTPRLLIPAGG